MNTHQARTRLGGIVDIPMAALETLNASLRGALHLPASDSYEDARRIWNGMIDRKPAVIARCAGTADVVAAVNFAREHDLLVAVRGGGHNVSGNAVCDGGLMIDLSGMRGVHVDPKSRRARAGGGATWGDFDAETQTFGLATTGGLISDTGVAGLTLGGGMGWLTPSYGLACDNLASAEVVTADGNVVTASETENSDLFWGLRGGGGNFGVVTSFEFQVHPVGPLLFGGMVLYPMAEARGILRRFVDFMDSSEDRLAALAAFTKTPDGTLALALMGVFNGPVEAGAAAMAPLRGFGSPLHDTFGPYPYRQLQTLFDAGVPSGWRYYWKSSFLDHLPDQALDIVTGQAEKRPSLSSKIFLEFLGGAFARVPRADTVFDHRQSPYDLLIISQWEDPSEDAANRAWARETWDAMEPFASSGVYVNYLGTVADEESDRLREAYGPGKYDRLVALKRQFDPTNLFRMNQNISPD